LPWWCYNQAMLLKRCFVAGLALLISILILSCFYRFTANSYLPFSDGAKFADIGRNVALGNGYGSSFARFSETLGLNKQGLFPATLIPPVTPYLNAVSFRLFGVSDFRVIGVSAFFYLVLIFSTFLLGKKLWGNLAGVIAAIAVAADVSFLNYATSGASEPLFAAEIVIAALLFTQKRKWSDILGFLTLVLMYFTRAHAPFFIFPLLFYFIQLKTQNYRKTLRIFFLGLLTIVLLSAVAIFIPGISFGKVLSERILVSLGSNSSFAPANDVLRMGQYSLAPLILANIGPLIKKLFYNLYNFYKLLPNIFSPYLLTLFVISLFRWDIGKVEKAFKITVLTTGILVFIVNAMTIPLFRYLHPLIPFIYLLAGAELTVILRQISKKRQSVNLAAFFLVLFFVVGQVSGYIFLDSRFNAKLVNKDKPPVYVTLSKILKDNTEKEQIVVTNLDTWGSWYGERKTIWFPLTPEALNTLKVPVDAIYLTSYLMDDEDNYMGEGWRQIFSNPALTGYKLKGVYEIKAEETYERTPARAILLIRK
jgi:4-amino-4-deoxy-L-arabinose transferase-like glycosyltransferase